MTDPSWSKELYNWKLEMSAIIAYHFCLCLQIASCESCASKCLFYNLSQFVSNVRRPIFNFQIDENEIFILKVSFAILYFLNLMVQSFLNSPLIQNPDSTCLI